MARLFVPLTLKSATSIPMISYHWHDTCLTECLHGTIYFTAFYKTIPWIFNRYFLHRPVLRVNESKGSACATDHPDPLIGRFIGCLHWKNQVTCVEWWRYLYPVNNNRRTAIKVLWPNDHTKKILNFIIIIIIIITIIIIVIFIVVVQKLNNTVSSSRVFIFRLQLGHWTPFPMFNGLKLFSSSVTMPNSLSWIWFKSLPSTASKKVWKWTPISVLWLLWHWMQELLYWHLCISSSGKSW